MKYLSDAITDEEISSWKTGDTIIINSPTGSGKSHFVLSKLLRKAVEVGKPILYFCNRKILDEQLTVKAQEALTEFFGTCDSIPDEYLEMIHIVTYQYCETKRVFQGMVLSPTEEKRYYAKDISYYIFDEAHYFIDDALFNAGTDFWRNKFSSDSINIFLTATPEPLKLFLAVYSNRRFNFIENLKQIQAKRYNRAVMRKKMELQQKLPPLMRKMEYRGVNITKRYIDEKCREIDIYGDCIRVLKERIEYRKNDIVISPEELHQDYHQYRVSYFQEYSEIISEIQKTSDDEKWLVFVDKEEDGIRLECMLSQNNISNVFLSAKSKKINPAKKEFENIVQNQKFDCRILIATKVLDCGVSIVDPQVKHIALKAIQKTTFLQMIGRYRFASDEQINLYIGYHDIKSIQGYYHKIDLQVSLLTDIALLNCTDYERMGRANDEQDGMREYFLYSENKRENIIEKIRKSKAAFVYTKSPYDRKKTSEYEKKSNVLLAEFEYSETAILAALYEINNLSSALKDYRKTGDPIFFLKGELNWINKEYDERNWLTYAESMANLCGYLDRACNTWMSKAQQVDFSSDCVDLFKRLPVPPQSISRSSNSRRAVGLNILNKAFREKGLPYQIESKQKYAPNKITQWCLKKTSE